jgi:membrane-bound lytic murein transglycosylase B
LRNPLRSTAPLLLLSLAACAHHPVVPTAKPVAAPSAATGYLGRPEVHQFIDGVVQKDGLDRPWVEQAFARAQRRQSVIDAITKPYEAKPWYQYETIFVNDARVQAGAAFWDLQAALLDKVQAQYGVPAGIIVAIVGVESYYGRQHGGYPVMDALSTLSFDYPARAPFFQTELEQFLLMCREQTLDPLKPMGSYAGAMGTPQFMPDSYRQYAVDFDGDGKRDIWDNWADILGSVANYFKQHGWEPNGLIVVPAAMRLGSEPPATLAPTTVGALRQAGVVLSSGAGDDAEALLVSLQEQDATVYWVGLHNFRVITQYNKSPLYAMAVVQLAQSIAQYRATEGHNAPP